VSSVRIRKVQGISAAEATRRGSDAKGGGTRRLKKGVLIVARGTRSTADDWSKTPQIAFDGEVHPVEGVLGQT